MSTIKRFEEIEAWQTARELTRKVYSISNAGEFSRDFGLRDQMRRASVSIMSNIAEGFESRTEVLFLDFLGRAKASAGELRAQFYVAHDAQYLTADQLLLLGDLCENCSSQISRFMDYLKRSNPPKSTSSPKTFRRTDVEKSRRPDVPTSGSGSAPKTFRRSDVSTFRRSS
jgi:four helix bundle protein